MSDQSPAKKEFSSARVFLFIVILCFVAALVLSIVAYSLASTQAAAKKFDMSKQMLIAAKVLSPEGNFLVLEDGKPEKARFESDELVVDPDAPTATDEEIKEVAALRIRPLVTNDDGEVFSLESKDLELESYIAENEKDGYGELPLKLFYAILPNSAEDAKVTADEVAEDLKKAAAFVFPVSGFGLWAPIYGYLAVADNGDEVIGTTWYDHAETPGLGANIAEASWQKQFYGKVIFEESASGETDYATAALGIVVVKGQVKAVYGDSPKAKSAVDGIAGSTLTGDGVTNAYRDSLAPYRALLVKLAEGGEKSE